VVAVRVATVGRVARPGRTRLDVRVAVGADHERIVVPVVESVVAAFTCPRVTRKQVNKLADVGDLSYTRMWANAQRDGRPAEHRWGPSVQRRKVWLTPTTRCRAVTLPRRETR